MTSRSILTQVDAKEINGSQVRSSVLTLVLAVLLWEGVWLLTAGNGFAHSWEVAGLVGVLARQEDFWVSLLATVLLTLFGVVLGGLVALALAAVVVATPFVEKSSRGTLFFLRSIPSVALIPLLLASLGSRTAVVISLVIWLVATKLVFFAIRGFHDLSSSLADQAALLRLSQTRRMWSVRLPAASAMITTGLRLTVNRAYGGVVLGGLLAGTPGIGRNIQLARVNADSDLVLAYTVIAATLGVAFFWAFKFLEEKIVKWRAAG